MTPLDAIGYGILTLMVIGAFSYAGWQIWQSYQDDRTPPQPPGPRPPVDPPGWRWQR